MPTLNDRSLRAVVHSRQPLHYAEGADALLDRPGHVRAASSMAWLNDVIALVQDDANFVALVDPGSGSARAIALPAGEGGLRQFDDGRGNKKYKLDLEACAAIDTSSGPLLLALGSGSKKRRRTILTVDGWRADAPGLTLTDATTLYERLERESAFAGSDMNIEGALVVGDQLRLFGRGNGKAQNGLLPLNATCELSLDALLAYLHTGGLADPPAPTRAHQYDLGVLGGITLGFTDAARFGADVLFSAAAEASADASADGLVGGSVLGVIDVRGRVRYTELCDADGHPFREKVEGLVLARDGRSRALIVIDPDDASRPAELCEVELRGAWT